MISEGQKALENALKRPSRATRYDPSTVSADFIDHLNINVRFVFQVLAIFIW